MRALVLRKQSYGEADLIVQFFLESGRIGSGFAPGARKSRRRFPHQFHLAGVYDVHAPRDFESGALIRIQSCDLKSFHPKLIEDVEQWTRWSMVLEWILADEGQGFDFEEVLELMRAMAEEKNAWAFYKFFILQMQVHGLLPRLDRCIACGSPVLEHAVFSVSEGGLGHAHCLRGSPLSQSTLEALTQVLDPTKSVADLDIRRAELDEIMVPFLSYHLGRSLKSYRLFDQLKPEAQA